MKTTVNGVEIEYTDTADLARKLTKLRQDNQEKYDAKFGVKPAPVAAKVVEPAPVELVQKTEDAPVVESVKVVEVADEVEVKQVAEEGPKVEEVIFAD